MRREPILNWLQHRAIQAAPYEVCGFILDDGEIIEVANCAGDPTVAFEMTHADLSKRITAEQVSRIIAIWHTHPKGSRTPSPRDIESMNCGAVQPDWMYLIATPSAVTKWNPKHYAPQDNSFWEEFIY